MCAGKERIRRVVWVLRAGNSFIIRVLVSGTLAALLSVTAFSQTDEDVINPDRPGIADGSNVVGSKVVQIETGAHFEFRRDGDTREHTFFMPALFRFGIGGSWEARVEGNTFTRVTEFDASTKTDETSGFAPTSIGFKYHILPSEDKDPVFSLGTIVRVFPAWGTKEFRPQHPTGDVRLAADWNFAPKLSLNPNIGIARYEDDQGRLFTTGLFAATLSYLPTKSKKLNPFIDIGTQSSEASNGRSSAVLDGGVAYTIGHNFEVDATIATRVHGVTAPKCLFEFGFSWRSKPFH